MVPEMRAGNRSAAESRRQALAGVKRDVRAQKLRVSRELRQVGVTTYGLLHAECQDLPMILHQDEHIQGVVYGHYENGFAIMVATDHRVLFIDHKPLFLKAEEVGYDLVGGVSFASAAFLMTVTLHTRIGDYTLKTMNFASAKRFIDFIELRCLDTI